MTIYNESGYKVDIEDIFHELTKRLLQIDYQIGKKEIITVLNEDVLEMVRQEITTYSYDKALAALKTNVNEIEQLKVKIEENKHNISIAGWWGDEVSDDEKVSVLNTELDTYRTDLQFLIDRIENSQSSYIHHLSNLKYPKIQTNLTVEQVGGLLYFLLIHQKDIIRTNIKQTCHIISKVIATVDSDNPNGDNLRNVLYKIPKKRKVLDFWRDRFLEFFQDSQEGKVMN